MIGEAPRSDDDGSESWRPVLGFEGLYEVSDRGRVRNARAGRVLRPNTISRYGHQQVKLCKGGRTFDRLVSRLVLEAFVGPCPPGMQARHVNDPNARNNALDNLAWGTPLENSADQFRHGTVKQSPRRQNIRLRAERAERDRLKRLAG